MEKGLFSAFLCLEPQAAAVRAVTFFFKDALRDSGEKNLVRGFRKSSFLKPSRKNLCSLINTFCPMLPLHRTDRRKTFHALGYNQVLVGTVESFPELKNVMAKLKIAEKKKVALMPFMLVAGDHAKNDMAGEEDSWKSELEEEGYEVRVIMKGLGEFSGIRKIFLEHIEEAM